jgi:hypothetical protein
MTRLTHTIIPPTPWMRNGRITYTIPHPTAVRPTGRRQRAGHVQSTLDLAPAAVRAATTLELLAEMTVLGRSDVLVGAASSNVMKLALALRGAEGLGLRTAWSVDGAPSADGWDYP